MAICSICSNLEKQTFISTVYRPSIISLVVSIWEVSPKCDTYLFTVVVMTWEREMDIGGPGHLHVPTLSVDHDWMQMIDVVFNLRSILYIREKWVTATTAICFQW